MDFNSGDLNRMVNSEGVDFYIICVPSECVVMRCEQKVRVLVGRNCDVAGNGYFVFCDRSF